MREFLKKIDSFMFGGLKDLGSEMLEKECLGMDTLLDVGCGDNSPIGRFSRKMKKVVGVDGFQPSIEKSQAKEIHHEYCLMDVMDLRKKFSPGSFDVVVAFDLIEHLEKKDGLKLIGMLEEIAAKKVILLTPKGFLPQGEYCDNKCQVHLSGWEVDEMRKLGYRVRGFSGWKFFRGECARPRFRPEFFWMRMSLLSQYFTTNHPRHAFAMFCVKDKRT